MPDVPFPPEPEPTRAERAERAVSDAIHYALTGRTDGHLRRPILFVVAITGVAVGVLGDSLIAYTSAVLALVSILLLALGDNVDD